MKIVVISDTHGGHEKLAGLEGDVLIHCGDFCQAFTKEPEEVEQVDEWFGKQEFDLVLCVGGNHDFGVEGRIEAGEPVFRNAVWLQDAMYTHHGVNFFGSPWIPHLQGWAFYMSSEGLQEKWSMIPTDTDVLITHTPPHGILDQPRSGKVNLGCPHLRERVETVKPSFHLFGHVHASAGVQEGTPTTFVNAAVVDGGLRVSRPAVSIDLNK